MYCTSNDFDTAYTSSVYLLCILTLHTHSVFSLCILTLCTHSDCICTHYMFTLYTYFVYSHCILVLYTLTQTVFSPHMVTQYTYFVYSLSILPYLLSPSTLTCHCFHAGHSPVYIIAVVSTRLRTYVHTVYCVYLVTVVGSVWVSFLSALQYGPSHMDWVTLYNCWKSGVSVLASLYKLS